MGLNNLGVLRVVSVTLLVASFLTVAVQAQRSGATFQGITRLGAAHSGFVGPPSLSRGFFSQRRVANGGFFSQPGFANRVILNRSHRHHRRDTVLVPYSWLDYDPFWYEPSDTEEAVEPAAPAAEQHNDGQSFIMKIKKQIPREGN